MSKNSPANCSEFPDSWSVRMDMEREVVFFKRHLCPDWDYMEIGPGDVEWEECCLCKYSPEPVDFEV